VSKTKLESNLNDLFGMSENTTSISEAKGELVAVQPRNELTNREGRDFSGDIDTDYRYARENLYEIIENGSHALHELVEIAKSSEHPRAFEVVASLMKTLTDANKDLLEVQAKVKKLKQEDNIQTGPNNVTNALFVGSTTELQNMLKDNLEDKS
tara:strand:- start:1857 stop:2318 length:462 start_codon:yes stop_codon:yes gene_type:complete